MGAVRGAGILEVEVAADVDRVSRTHGFAWRLSRPDGTAEMGAAGRRSFAGATRAQLKALEMAVRRARVLGGEEVRLRTSDRRLRHAVDSMNAARRPPPVDTLPGPRAPGPPGPRVSVVLVASAAPGELVVRARQARAVAESRAERLRLRRRDALEGVAARARAVALELGEGGWVANGRYRLTLDPMHCDCPAWGLRWRGVPIPGRRDARIPCKHLVALAERLGVRDPEVQILLARRAAP